MSAFAPIGTLDTLPIWSGIIARRVEGREMTFAVVEIDAHASAVMHKHANEQNGLLISGTMTFTIGDEIRELRAGDTYVIPGNVPHEATAGAEGAVVIDVFAPIRADWQRLTPQPPRTPIWP
jgi:quercetin dioxygenase-like cupin family protein